MPEQFKNTPSTPSHESTSDTEKISKNGPSLGDLKRWKKVGILAMTMAKAMTADATASELPEDLITHDATKFIESLKKAPSPEMKVTSTGTVTIPKKHNLNTPNTFSDKLKEGVPSPQILKNLVTTPTPKGTHPRIKLKTNYHHNPSPNNNFGTPKTPSGKPKGVIHLQPPKGLKTIQTPKGTFSGIKLNPNYGGVTNEFTQPSTLGPKTIKTDNAWQSTGLGGKQYTGPKNIKTSHESFSPEGDFSVGGIDSDRQ